MNNKPQAKLQFWSSRVVLYAILILFGMSMIFPLFYMMVASFKTPKDFQSNPRRLLPFTQEVGEYNGQPARLYEFTVDGETVVAAETIINPAKNEVNKVFFGYFALPNELEDALSEGEHSIVGQSQAYTPVLEVSMLGFDSLGNEVDLRDAGTRVILRRNAGVLERGTTSAGKTVQREYATYGLYVDPEALVTDTIEVDVAEHPVTMVLESGLEDEEGNDIPGAMIQLVAYSIPNYADAAEEIIITNTGEERELFDSTGSARTYDVFTVAYGGQTQELLLVTRPKIAIFAGQDDPSFVVVANGDDNQRVEHVEFQVENYNALLELENFDRSLINTIFVTILVVLGQVSTSLLGGYAFSRIRFAGRDAIFMLYLGSIMIPFVVLIVPMYRLMVELGWQARIVSLIIPWIFTAYGTFLMRQFFMSIPKEIEEAAFLDGCSRFRILWQIFVPLSTPAIATQAIFTFLYAWNSFLWPLFMFGDQPSDSRVLTLSLISLANRASSGEPNLVFTGAAVTILPPVIVFILAQKYFVEGIATSGLKG